MALLLPDISNHYYSRIIRGVLREAHQVPLNLLLFETPGDETTFNQLLMRLRAKAVLLYELRQRGLSTDYYLTCPSGDVTSSMARQALLDLFSRANPPTAIIGWDDSFAAKLIQSAPSCGLNVPRDLSIMGCGNMDVGTVTVPALTTIEQFPEEIGQKAIRLLLKRITEGLPREQQLPEKIKVRVELLVRDSCVPPAVSSQ